MAWQRIGQIYCPDGTKSWAQSHAALPTPVHIEDDIFRIFFSTRDAENRSHVAWVDLDLTSTPQIVREATVPTLSPGVSGTFDESGVSIGCVTKADGGVRLYYMGWNLGARTRWHNAIGVALAQTPLDDFERYSAGPVLDRSPEDPYTLSYPWVMRRSSTEWWMWYGSNLVPDVTTGMQHAIKFCRSSDGIRWERDGTIAIGFKADNEYALARPTVVETQNGLLMCFSCRGDRYQIGCAQSDDGRIWTRADGTMGLERSPESWDSEMTCYPALFEHRGRLWLAYNGNGYGATGFGLAVWQD